MNEVIDPLHGICSLLLFLYASLTIFQSLTAYLRLPILIQFGSFARPAVMGVYANLVYYVLYISKVANLLIRSANQQTNESLANCLFDLLEGNGFHQRSVDDYFFFQFTYLRFFMINSNISSKCLILFMCIDLVHDLNCVYKVALLSTGNNVFADVTKKKGSADC